MLWKGQRCCVYITGLELGGTKMTEKEYKIEISPGVLELLGPSLYTNIYYVLAELIANAYDADAKNVYIIEKDNAIIVEDDGNGMSYKNGDITKYLEIARISRSSNEEATTALNRHKMGRKGVGKLAALSVSDEVYVKTVVNGEKSGFVLSRHVSEDKKLEPIAEENIVFEKITTQGTAIVMTNPQYKLHVTSKAIRRNLTKVFPIVGKEFRIHIIKNGVSEVVDCVEEDLASQLSNVVILGDEFKYMASSFHPIKQERFQELCDIEDEKVIPIEMVNNQGEKGSYELKIKGWIGAYKTTRNRKSEISDFPDNYISLYANGKMGEFNILPLIGKNKMTEVYVVGQLHVDLFELTELPDMALSNRQGYKTDDLRYQKVLEYVRNELLPLVLRMRDIYSDLNKADKKEKELEKSKAAEHKFKKAVNLMNKKVSKGAAEAIIKKLESGNGLVAEDVEEIVAKEISANSADIGIKPQLDMDKKKILISHTRADKDLADVLYEMLKFNNVPAKDILYTNSDDEEARIPEVASGKSGIYDYLREFFVNSASDQKPYIFFVTSAKMGKSWGAVTEVGACWITESDHKIFNLYDESAPDGEKSFRPDHPLDTDSVWQECTRNKEKEICLDRVQCDTFVQKIRVVCEHLGYDVKSRDENKANLIKLVRVE